MTPFDQLSRMPSPGKRLTRREIEVLRLVADGMTNEQTARRLGYQPPTVATMLQRIRAKLEAPSRAAAVDRGWRLGYLGQPEQHTAGPERFGAAS